MFLLTVTVISSDPVGLPPPKIELVSKSSTSMCDLDLLWDREDKTTLIFDVSGIQTDPKFLRTHAPVLYFSSVNGTESDVRMCSWCLFKQ